MGLLHNEWYAAPNVCAARERAVYVDVVVTDPANSRYTTDTNTTDINTEEWNVWKYFWTNFQDHHMW